MSLQFAREITWDTWRDALSEVVSWRTDKPNEWRIKSHQKIPRAPADELFVETSESDAATLTISITDGGGDPRYGEILNNIAITLHIKTTNESMHLTGSSRGTYLCNEPIYVTPTLELKERLRQALRRRLGAEHDRSMQALLALPSIREAQRQRSHLAKLWLDEALSLPPQPYGWGDLLRLAEEINGKTEALLARRLQEAPCDESTWREAQKSPPKGHPRREIDAMLKRFERRLPTGLPWQRCEDGVGPGGHRTPLHRVLFHELTAFRFGASAADQYTLEAGPSMLSMKRTSGPLLATLHEFNQPHETDQLAVSYLWGEGEDDFICILRASQRSNALTLGEALCISGSEEFQRRARSAISSLAPFRWILTDERDLFQERAKRDLQIIDPSRSPHEQLAQVLSLSDLPPELAQLAECRCEVSSCEHQQKISSALKALQAAHANSPSAESYRAAAKIAALQVLQMFILQKRLNALAIQQATEHIARGRAISA